MAKTKKKKVGMKDVCADCGKPVYWTGDYWKHTDDGPRHPANPVWDRDWKHTEDE